MMKLKELIKDLDYSRLDHVTDCEIKGIACNSLGVHPGYLFVAIKGSKVDGHQFINQAIANGARALILQKDLPLDGKIAKIIVPDSQRALGCVSASFFKHPADKLKVIGITGTNGKTTVSYLIEQILSCAGLQSGVIGTVNYRVGTQTKGTVNTTPSAEILQSLLQEIVLAKSKYAIIEVSSHSLAQQRVGAINFCQAIFTNLSREHLDYHKSLADYFACKASLFTGLAADACAIINIDDPFGKKLLKKVSSPVLTYGFEQTAQIQAKDLKLSNQGSRFQVITPRGKMTLNTTLVGRHNVYNILAAVSSGISENIDFQHIVSGIASLKVVPGRLQRIDCGQSFDVFIDYAHTEDALEKVLLALRQISKKRIILVFGCGGDRDKDKRPKMAQVAARLADFVIITSDNPRSEDPQQI
ncbi:MAG: UDP-N-acetylmuramoyl-L-alanyl-D-glutamate--2,6-diaminopimelate ligase, partial [Candidatus Omnitrophica bacterium]|nr:UDP-N-acetylmuramoyl-L-alanyl-D-glutamate--2,6-diaminopimelate ligase [Candidatus Omnitrophota bacterium]